MPTFERITPVSHGGSPTVQSVQRPSTEETVMSGAGFAPGIFRPAAAPVVAAPKAKAAGR
jgi:hypothetical protein